MTEWGSLSRGDQKVTLIPVIRSTSLSRKLKRTPVKFFEFPKLSPNPLAGMSRLCPKAGAAARAAASRMEAGMRIFISVSFGKLAE